jgi:ABC-2 type transport system ATP-binding protein
MISVNELSKIYRGRQVLSQVSFRAVPGHVTGFLGPNGAGKTTTMRILLGLTRATSGVATVDGKLMRELPNAGRTIGVLLDAKALSPARTGRENLLLAAMTMGLAKIDIDAALDRVGLDPEAGRKRVAAYSLGMRQRLGIAQALLGDPQVIVLDEPANGLDPAGIMWMRGLLRGLANDGRTVLLSSHLIGEVEKVADHVVLINAGKIVAESDIGQIAESSGVRVVSPQAPELANKLDHQGITVLSRDGDVLVVDAEIEKVARLAFAERILVQEIAPRAPKSLEDVFFELTTSGATR